MQVIRFWKPYGVLTKFTDAEGRPTLADYIDIKNVYAAGRLDLDSEGLLLLTDSGRLQTRLTDPRHAHPRTYWVQVERVPTPETLTALAKGVQVGSGADAYRTRPTRVRLFDAEPLIDGQPLPERDPPIRQRKNVPTAWLELTLTEGRNRQVRRMTAAVGHPTLRLIRWATGDVTLAGLRPGEWQTVPDSAVRSLMGRG